MPHRSRPVVVASALACLVLIAPAAAHASPPEPEMHWNTPVPPEPPTPQPPKPPVAAAPVAEATTGASEPIGAPAPTAAAAAPEAAAPVMRKHWYGGYTLMVDGISLLTAPVVVGLGGYFVAAPIVHCVHKRPLVGLLSLGLRVTTPVTFAVVASGSSRHGEFGNIGAVVGGFAVGALVAMLVDATVLANETVPR